VAWPASNRPLDDVGGDRRIGDYALIGDCETAALVGRDGSIDWLCWPAFDSEACFARLLGDTANGRWRIAPADPVERTARAYRADTLVLDTRFETADGVVTVTDFMPIRGEASDLIRIVACERGRVRMRSQLALRFDYGRLRPWLRRLDGEVLAVAGPDGVRVASDAPLEIDDADCVAEFVLEAGKRAAFDLCHFPSHRRPPAPIDPDQALDATLRAWRAWAATCRYEGPWRETVVRSLITLKALTYRPTGGIVAAVTSSVPEARGGARNWDYRFCWLRDATFTLLSLLHAGYREEAAAWRDWLLRAVAGDPGRLQPLYGVDGRHRLPEWEAPWLSGMAGARPVRFGNAAAAQAQLDVYGEVADALFQAERLGVPMSEPERELMAALVEAAARLWRKPDRGIWEVRGPPQHFTHSRLLAWAALDRGVRLGERGRLPGPLGRWRADRRRVRERLLADCFDPVRGAFVQAAHSTVLDASVLLIPHVGFLPAGDPRMTSTVEAIQTELMWNGFVLRYRPELTADGVGGPEAAFLACTFWLGENLILQGRRDEGAAVFERALAARNDVGLLAEEYDPLRREPVGNFPQALSHLSLVNTAFSLAGWGAAEERRR